MKKILCKTLSFLLVLSMITTVTTFVAYADAYPTGFKTGFEETFTLNSSKRFVLTNEVTGAIETTLQFNQNSGTGSWAIGTDPVNGGTRGQNLKLVVPESGNAPQLNLQTIVDKNCVFGVSLYITEESSVTFSAKGNGNNWATGVQNIISIAKGNLKIMGTKDEHIVDTIQTGWYDVRIASDFTAHKMYITIAAPDGTVTTYAKNFNSTSEGFHYFNITTGLGTDIYVDDMSMFYTDDPEFDIEFDKIYGGEVSYDINFTQEVICTDKASFISFSEDGVELNAEVTPRFNNSYLTGLTLTFAEPLKGGTPYSFTLSGMRDLYNNTLDGEYVITDGKAKVWAEFKYGASSGISVPTDKKLAFTAGTLNASGDEKSVYVLNGNGAVEFEDEFTVYPEAGLNELYVELRDSDGNVICCSEPVSFYGINYLTEEVLTDDDFETGGRLLPIKGTGKRNDEEYKDKAYASVTGKAAENEYVKLDSYKDPTGSVGNALSYMQTYDAKSASVASNGDCDKIVSYEADYSFVDFNAVRELMRIKIYKDGTYASNVYTYAFRLDTEGKLWLNSYNGETQQHVLLDVPEIKINTWYSFRADYDLKNHTCDMYFEDVCVAKDVQILKSSYANLWNYVGYLNLNTGTPVENDTTTSIRIDNVYERYITLDTTPSVSFKAKYSGCEGDVFTVGTKLIYSAKTVNAGSGAKTVYVLNDGEAVEFENEFTITPQKGLNELYVEVRDENNEAVCASDILKFAGEELNVSEALTDDDFETGGRTLPIKGYGKRNDEEYKNKAYAGITGKEAENEYVKLDTYKDPTGSIGNVVSYMQTVDAKNESAPSHGDCDKTVSYKADYSFVDFNATRELMRIKVYKDGTYASNVYVYAFKLDTAGKLWINSYSGETQKLIPVETPEFKTNTWYSFRADYDLKNHTCDMYFEDVCVAKDVQIMKSSYAGSWNYVGYLNLNTGTPVENDMTTSIRIDNVYEGYVEREELEVLDISYASTSEADAVILHDGNAKAVRFFTAIYSGDKLAGITFSDLTLGADRIVEAANVVEGFTKEEGVTYETKSFFWDAANLEPFCVSK